MLLSCLLLAFAGAVDVTKSNMNATTAANGGQGDVGTDAAQPASVLPLHFPQLETANGGQGDVGTDAAQPAIALPLQVPALQPPQLETANGGQADVGTDAAQPAEVFPLQLPVLHLPQLETNWITAQPDIAGFREAMRNHNARSMRRCGAQLRGELTDIPRAGEAALGRQHQDLRRVTFSGAIRIVVHFKMLARRARARVAARYNRD